MIRISCTDDEAAEAVASAKSEVAKGEGGGGRAELEWKKVVSDSLRGNGRMRRATFVVANRHIMLADVLGGIGDCAIACRKRSSRTINDVRHKLV